LAVRARGEPRDARDVPALPPRAGPFAPAPHARGTVRAGNARELQDLMPDSAKKPHTLADHVLGMEGGHTHEADSGHDHDHDHDDFGKLYPETDALWQQDPISLLSVGIDIGSAGTQVIFSRVELRRLAEALTSRFFVVGREALYQSPVALTPYQSEDRIDERAVGQIIRGGYPAARAHPGQGGTSAVNPPG